ncbi:MAG: glycosyltransferase, partial [Cyanobacteria bacterium J06632_19]
YLMYGLRVFSQSNSGLPTQVLTRYTIIAIALFLVCTYFLGIDLTLAARFIFVFAPGIILLVSALLSVCWQRLKKLLKNGQFAVTIVWLIALTGGIIVTMNLGYLQNQRPDLLASLIHKTSQAPVLIATTHKHHGQTGRMMGLAWEFKYLYAKEYINDWQFFLAHRNENTETYTDAVKRLQKSISQITHPFDLWLVNFNSSVNLESEMLSPISMKPDIPAVISIFCSSSRFVLML